MNRAEKRRQMKLARKAGKSTKFGHEANPFLQQSTPIIQQAMEIGVQHHRQGNLSEARGVYQQILDADPANHEILHLLGLLHHQKGQNEDAVDLINKALSIKPDFAEAHTNLGLAFYGLGLLEKAAESFRNALAIKPDMAEAHNNLGGTLNELRQWDEASASCIKALAIKPDYTDAHNNLGLAFSGQKRFEEAVVCYREALAINSNFAQAHSNMGNAQQELGQLDEAVSSFHSALSIDPEFAEAHNNLGNALKDQGRLDEARESYQKALSLKPDYAQAHSNLGNVQKNLGQLEEAVASFKTSLAFSPDQPEVHSNLLLAEQYRLGHTCETLYTLHREWGERHAGKYQEDWQKHANSAEPDRRLRIGFVSPDLGRHPVGYFIVRLFEHMPERDIETVAYSDCRADELTERIKTKTHLWRDSRGISDEELAKTIRDDGIDILFDLSGHSAKNRLLLFARKPAPLQVTWAGYVSTTGLSAMDYLLSDACSTKADEEESYSENVIRMPDGWLCYDPPVYAPEVGPLPYETNGGITFASFCNPAKINKDVVSAWATILCGVANSRLLIKYSGIDSGSNVARLTDLFHATGVSPSQLVLEGAAPHDELLARYNDVDIALDTFPYSGGLTTYEALWMGVPVITFPGSTFASRHSVSHLTTLGLPELVGADQDDYVKLAVELAQDTNRLAGLRRDLRDMMDKSLLCDGVKFANNFSKLMRDIWRQRCVSR